MQIDWVPVAVDDTFDYVGKLQELNELADLKTLDYHVKKLEIEEELKNLKKILGE